MQFSKSAHYFKKASTLEPNEPLFAYLQGISEYEAHSYKNAIMSFKKVNQIDPNFKKASVMNYLGICYYHEKEYTPCHLGPVPACLSFLRRIRRRRRRAKRQPNRIARHNTGNYKDNDRQPQQNKNSVKCAFGNKYGKVHGKKIKTGRRGRYGRLKGHVCLFLL